LIIERYQGKSQARKRKRKRDVIEVYEQTGVLGQIDTGRVDVDGILEV
jgi:hypothetical protein